MDKDDIYKQHILAPEFKKSFPNIAWKDITGMRDKLIHDYFSVNLDDVWDTVQQDLPLLKLGLSQR